MPVVIATDSDEKVLNQSKTWLIMIDNWMAGKYPELILNGFLSRNPHLETFLSQLICNNIWKQP